jgi:hypothetical protein
MSRHSGNHQSFVSHPSPPPPPPPRFSPTGDNPNNAALLAGMADRGSPEIMNDIDPHMRTIEPGVTKILFKAKIMDSCVDAWNTDTTRIYFYVLENGYESNNPYWAILPWKEILACCCIPPSMVCCGDVEVCSNQICPGTDHVKRVYYDRGPYDEHDCLHCTGLVVGRPRTLDHGSKIFIAAWFLLGFYV